MPQPPLRQKREQVESSCRTADSDEELLMESVCQSDEGQLDSTTTTVVPPPSREWRNTHAPTSEMNAMFAWSGSYLGVLISSTTNATQRESQRRLRADSKTKRRPRFYSPVPRPQTQQRNQSTQPYESSKERQEGVDSRVEGFRRSRRDHRGWKGRLKWRVEM